MRSVNDSSLDSSHCGVSGIVCGPLIDWVVMALPLSFSWADHSEPHGSHNCANAHSCKRT